MQKVAVFTLNFFSLGIVAHVSNTLDALTAFLIAGIIPGTTYSLPPLAMLGLVLMIGMTIVALSVRLFDDEPVQKIMPRKRYGRL